MKVAEDKAVITGRESERIAIPYDECVDKAGDHGSDDWKAS